LTVDQLAALSVELMVDLSVDSTDSLLVVSMAPLWVVLMVVHLAGKLETLMVD
jgi:hypothetical protein